MWYEPPKYIKEVIDFNEIMKQHKGELEPDFAKISLAKFLYRNLGFTTELLTGQKAYPDQIITIKGMLQSNYTLCVWGRGVSKTWTAAVYCILQCIFRPNTNILIAGPTFRTARFIFNHIETMVDSPEGRMLQAAFGAKSKRSDEFKWKINGGSIVAIPLNGEKIRGFRADVLLIDEFLLMSEEIVEKVLIPYLVAPQEQKQRQLIRAKEDKLIGLGMLTEAERKVFPNDKKMIGLSSASYTCEYLYKKFQEYVEQITTEKPSEDNSRYFVSQMAWDSVHPDRMDKNVIRMAQNNEGNSANFKREYGAQFIDDSDSYFSMKKMMECTVKDGSEPTQLLRGLKDKKYILAIDPNSSGSETSDHFAMCLLELRIDDKDKVGGTVVHTYARAGQDLKDHIRYLFYLMTNFPIEMIIIDHAGYQFIEAANENELFRSAKINLKIFEFSAEKDGLEYEEQLRDARRSFNQQMQRIVFTQYFSPDFIRKGNEWLQGCIDFKKIWFGSPIKGCPNALEKALSVPISSELVDMDKMDKDESVQNFFIDNQDALMKKTRYECASIEVKSSISGNQTFDLPSLMKRDKGRDRMRKDSYTSLLLGAWAMKCYTDIRNTPEQSSETFAPIMI